MMKRKEQWNRWVVTAAALCCLGIIHFSLDRAVFAGVGNDDFDHQSGKLYRAYDAVPEPYLAADSGDRNLAGFYELRQYPGSPPRIPHAADITFSGNARDCLACHAKGGYSAEFAKYIPVTPHPENSLCYQCHVQKVTDERFVQSTWQSITPPRLGLSFLASSPPSIPHSLQLRENCIACHTGPAAVVEIRVSHASRGNCRQCHVPTVQQEAFSEFRRK
ncbi:MAG: nitrate reductase cytochrome c-type subunit [Proteobacteria bacterium]|nr:nitrate reductase cytochrome c-type subunit [Pseudomonadota bacterium]